jgi:branched-chain amino acid transport system ATP-binding protein
MRTILGMTRIYEGTVTYEGRPTRGRSTPELARAGIGLVPEDRRIFADLTTLENLEIAQKRGPAQQWTIDRVFEFFPELKPHAQRRGGLLSGGQQQMLTIARTLMTNPRLLLLDEPSEGLAPMLVERILDRSLELKRSGLTILLAEQRLGFSLALSDHVYVLERGQVKYSGDTAELARDEVLQHQLLSV